MLHTKNIWHRSFIICSSFRSKVFVLVPFEAIQEHRAKASIEVKTNACAASHEIKGIIRDSNSEYTHPLQFAARLPPLVCLVSLAKNHSKRMSHTLQVAVEFWPNTLPSWYTAHTVKNMQFEGLTSIPPSRQLLSRAMHSVDTNHQHREVVPGKHTC